MVQQASNVRQEIDRINAQFVAAFNRGDAAGAAGVYTEDATILPPGSDMVQGRENIQGFWQAAMDAGIRAVNLETLDLSMSGEMAREIGRATLTIRPEGGAESTDTAKYVVVWEESGGEWRWAVDIWNGNA
ncbi:MAG: SgcJ/EcaC family oxidoreductase [Dehalococcoidia bacterium]